VLEIVGSKDRNHQHQTTGVLLFGGRPMKTLSRVLLSGGKSIRRCEFCYRGVTYVRYFG